jgi:hypothetical protein
LEAGLHIKGGSGDTEVSTPHDGKKEKVEGRRVGLKRDGLK